MWILIAVITFLAYPNQPFTLAAQEIYTSEAECRAALPGRTAELAMALQRAGHQDATIAPDCVLPGKDA